MAVGNGLRRALPEDLKRALVVVAAAAVVVLPEGAAQAQQEGRVFWQGAVAPGASLTVALSSGETVAASNLGWLGEWCMGVLKLQGSREWPCVKLGSSEAARSGDSCFEVGYGESRGQKGQLPIVRCGTISRVSPEHCFTTSIEPRSRKPVELGAGVFDIEGRLLGATSVGRAREHNSVAVEVLAAHWQDFVGGKNLDWVRYPPSAGSLYRTLAEPDELERTKPLSSERDTVERCCCAGNN